MHNLRIFDIIFISNILPVIFVIFHSSHEGCKTSERNKKEKSQIRFFSANSSVSDKVFSMNHSKRFLAENE